MKQVAVIVGSLRRESINLRFAKALEKLAEGRLAFKFADLSGVPLYNEDLWQNIPEPVTRLKAGIAAADGVLFVTPEYNRSMPAVTKNVIDWGSRPVGKSCWSGKKGALVGASPGTIGTAVAQSHLRAVLGGQGIALLAQPEVYLTLKPDLIDDDFSVTDAKTREMLAGFITKFAIHVDPGAR